jgi:hypothetical protein
VSGSEGPEPYHVGLVREHLAGRRVIAAMDVLVGSARLAEQLSEYGAEDVLLVGGSRGTGELGDEEEQRAVLLGTSGDSLMAGIRAFETALDEPPQVLRDAIERFDPDGDALVVTTLFSSRRELCGRGVFGARDPRWVLLEDKTTVDALWDAVGVPRAPSRVVPARRDALLEAAEELDKGIGTAWVADNRDGWHGGAAGLRWVRDQVDADTAVDDLIRIADEVRVMPFLDGRPCSIHGWVLGDEVIASRPCETVMWRQAGANRLVYGGAAATTWRPADADTRAMREMTHRVGEHLRDTVGYRGVFTIDGVLTADEGFLPTELNPRFGAAIATLGRGSGLPLYLLHCLSIDAPDLDWRATELEQAIIGGRAWAGANVMLDGVEVEPRTARVLRHGQGWRLVEPDPTDREDGQQHEASEEATSAGSGEDGEVARIELGPGPTGGFLRINLPQHPDGAPVAPIVAEMLPYIADHLGLDLPALEAAPDLRVSSDLVVG